MALYAMTNASAVNNWGIVPQCGSELHKFFKVLGVEFELVCMAGKELDIADVRFGNFKVECCLPMLFKVVIGFVGSLLLFGWHSWGIELEHEVWDVPVLELFGHHSIQFNVLE
jgi:hypothetical protein